MSGIIHLATQDPGITAQGEKIVNIELIATLASCVAALIAAIATIIVKYCKNEKVKQAAEETVEICEAILPYLEQAESYTNFSGAEKKAYVMTRMNQYAIDNGIPYDEELVDSILEQYIELTKTVNAKAPPSDETETASDEIDTDDSICPAEQTDKADDKTEYETIIVSLRGSNGNNT